MVERPSITKAVSIGTLEFIVLYIIYIDRLEIANPEQEQDGKHP
jgi:hypothetical protein